MKLILTLLMMTVSLWPAPMTSAAQEDTAHPHTPVYLLQNDRLSRLDMTTGTSQVVAELTRLANLDTAQSDRVDRRLWAADIDPQGRYLYQIEAWGRSSNRRILGAPTGAELIQVNLATNERRIISDSTTVFNFVLSPSGQRMIVFYYAKEYLYSTQQACILDLQTRQCVKVALDYVSTTGFWIDEDRFIIGTNDVNPLRLVDAVSGSYVTLELPSEWHIYSATRIPQSTLLLINVRPRQLSDQIPPINFLKYDLDTGDVQAIPYTALDTQAYLTVNELNLSPNGDYLVYRGLNVALVNFNSGELIHEFTSVYSAGWIDDETLIVQGSRDEGSLEIMRVNAVSGQITTLLSGEAAAGVLLIP